jgi:hypothetical protein
MTTGFHRSEARSTDLRPVVMPDFVPLSRHRSGHKRAAGRGVWAGLVLTAYL